MPASREELQDNKVKANCLTVSRARAEREERIQHILECLAAESSKGTPIIVEGKKDVETLRKLAIGGKIITAKSGKSLLDVVSEVEENQPEEAILLLDYDKRGKELTRLLKHHLETTKIVPNTTFWRELFSLVGKEIRDIESLTAYLETLEKKFHKHRNPPFKHIRVREAFEKPSLPRKT